MKKLIPHFSSTTNVRVLAVGADGESRDFALAVPKLQKDEFFIRMFEQNPHLVRLQVRAKNGKVLFEKSRHITPTEDTDNDRKE